MEITVAEIRRRIYSVRGFQIVLDRDLAEFYKTETRFVNRTVKQNSGRFPPDFVFRLTETENYNLKSQTSSVDSRGGRRHIPYAFTELGVAMLMGILRNSRAIQVNIEVMRAFVRIRQLAQNEISIPSRLDQIEEKLEQIKQEQERQVGAVLQGIQKLLATQDNETFNSEKQPKLIVYSQPDDKRIEKLILGKEVCLKAEIIYQAVAKYFGLKISGLKAITRVRSIVLPRQIAVYLIRKHTGSSFKEIGKGLGMADHSTAMHAYNKISAAVETDRALQEAVRAIQRSFAI